MSLATAMSVSALLFAPGTGSATPEVQPYIVGGEPAPSAQGAVSLALDDKGLFCTGTLIAPEWVVTAAHCTRFADQPEAPKPPAEMVVRSGSLGHDHGGQVSRVAEAIPHPGFNWGADATPFDDIALIRLTAPATADPVAITPVPVRADTLVRLLGWGMTSPDGTGDPAASLQQLDTHTTTPRSCDTVPGFNAGTELCVDNPSQTGVCFGDSGGPAISTRFDRPELVAVTSRGAEVTERCGDTPDVSTAIGPYFDWIVKVLATRGDVPVSASPVK